MKKTICAPLAILLLLLLAVSVSAAGLSEEEKRLCDELNEAVGKIEALENGVILLQYNSGSEKDNGIFSDSSYAETFKFQKRDGHVNFLKRTTTVSGMTEMKCVDGALWVRHEGEWSQIEAEAGLDTLAYYNGMTLRADPANIGKIEKTQRDGATLYHVEKSAQWLEGMGKQASIGDRRFEVLKHVSDYTVDSAGVLVKRADEHHYRAQEDGKSDESRGTYTLILKGYNDAHMQEIR